MNAEPQIQQPLQPAHLSPEQDVRQYHQILSEKYKDLDPEDVILSDDATALISFNGYYTLEGTPGAFFSIDTNMHIKEGATSPIYDVSLIVSLDGKTSYRIPFSGTFDGTTLTQRSNIPGGLEFKLNFSRPVGTGITAKCTGTVGPSGVESLPVLTGSTYNNPIPANLFAGEFYEQEPIVLKPGKPEKAAVKVMQILESNQVLYDFGRNDGELTPVPSYTYNMNMYYFAFPLDPANPLSASVQLIMGTAGEGGFACNNMTVDHAGGVHSRNLQTIPFFPPETPELPNLLSESLAAFSGYYQLPSIASKAFISIQAQYAVFEGILDLYCVKVAVSLDGVTSKGYYFDGNNMSFIDNVLSMPDQNIQLTFKRQYDPVQKSLVTISGSIDGHDDISGVTLFNPVPLSVFGGVPMTNSTDNSSIVIESDSKITYNNKVLDNFIYVPLMYILASPWFDPQTKKEVTPNTVLSLGTDGTSGNVSIVIDVPTDQTTFVYAIPPQSTK